MPRNIFKPDAQEFQIGGITIVPDSTSDRDQNRKRAMAIEFAAIQPGTEPGETFSQPEKPTVKPVLNLPKKRNGPRMIA